MPRPDTVGSIDGQLNDLRSRISELGQQVDTYKTKTAAALGAGVFLLLLAVGASYDLVSGKNSVWLVRGVTRETLLWIASALGLSALLLLAFGLVRSRRRDRGLDTRLEQMEQEYADLIERRDEALRRGY